MYRTPEENKRVLELRATKSIALNCQQLGRGLRAPWYIRRYRAIRAMLAWFSISVAISLIAALWFAVGGN